LAAKIFAAREMQHGRTVPHRGRVTGQRPPLAGVLGHIDITGVPRFRARDPEIVVDEIHIRREGAALRLKLPQRPDTLRDHVVSDGKTMSILANLPLPSDGRKLPRRPAGISFTRLALAVFGERLGDLTKSVRHLIKHPPDQQYVVVLGTAHSGNWVAKIEL